MSRTALPDRDAREAALDVSRSFIVQAPAGSGKTELLTLRFLHLLSISAQPEEVLAITFTRKAASEMRDRIIQALRSARKLADSGEQPLQDFERLRLTLAAAVLKSDRDNNWRLLDNPSRLRVQTIDSFCFYLASQLPVLSRLGGNPAVSEDVEHCFADAIDNTLAQLENDGPFGDDVERLLEHLDNDRGQVEQLLVNLLYKRDQWLPYVLELGQQPDEARRYLADNLDELVTETLTRLRALLAPFTDELVALLNFSTAMLIAEGKIEFHGFHELSALPDAEPQALLWWQRLADMLLTNNDTWRKPKGITKREGFPADDKAMKARIQGLLATLSEQAELEARIAELRLLPKTPLPGGRWVLLASLLNVLARLGSELLLSFRKFHVVDYTQTQTAALDALGPADDPTDIALALDHRLQHILVDEFQDTSYTQLRLLERLTAGWETDDGRTLFLVGDPMQSIYGFRNANVGIYLQVRESGINDLPLQPLTLSANFRSQANVVDWVNRVFTPAFPATADSSRGAVPYAPSHWVHEAEEDAIVSTLLIPHEEVQRQEAQLFEARQVIVHIQALRAAEPAAEIAILARTRPQLALVVQQLREAGIPWQATDMDRLDRVMPVADLLSLTRALLNPADRIAWLAILRAPWCGLRSAALLALSDLAGEGSLWTILQTPEALAAMDAEDRGRLAEVVEVLRLAMAMRFRRPLRQLVEATWTLLRGADCCGNEAEMESAVHFFTLLEQHDQGGGLHNLFEFEAHLAAAFAPSPTQSASAPAVQLMTMHKAKGLEFDHVILPCLGREAKQDAKALLLWHERLNAAGASRLFLATRSATGSDDDALYRLLQQERRIKGELEATRLLYIAITRARRSVLLLATQKQKDGEAQPPDKRSLLHRIWPQLEVVGNVSQLQLPVTTTVPVDARERAIVTPIRRLEGGIALSADEKDRLRTQRDSLTASDDSDLAAREYDDPLARCTGTLIHGAMEELVNNPSRLREERARLQAHWSRELTRLCPDPASLAQQLRVIEESLQRCLDDSAHGWIFKAGLAESACELPLSRRGEQGLQQFVIDRTFVDEAGSRWVIDYKTGTPRDGQSVEQFIAGQQALHHRQLATYGALFAQMEARPVRIAIYYTALSRLVEYADQTSPSATA